MEEHTREDEREGSDEATLVQLWWPRGKEGAAGTFEARTPDVVATKQIECKRFLVGWWHAAADSQKHLVVTVVATVAAKVSTATTVDFVVI
jgi:chitinase